ncbi:MAG: response regulator [Gemmatimonadetes bacterium]|nr:response regulator [Gemmatimonadota bacterium]
MTQIRVLLAEDDAGARTLLAQVLVACGHIVVAQVSTGRDAVDRALALNPDVVLLDVHMPDGSGIEAAERITRERPGTSVILFTGDASTSLSDADASATAAVAFLPKPAPPPVLDAAVRLAVGRAQQFKELRADADGARKALEDRKLIERAKWHLMKRMGLEESEAYRLLQRSAQNRGLTMVVIAQKVMDEPPPWPFLLSSDAR